MNMQFASINTISNQLVSVTDLIGNFLWLGIFIFIVGGLLRICLPHSYSNEATHRDPKDETKSNDTKKLNLLDSFPVDDSMKVEVSSSTHETENPNSVQKASSKIDLNKTSSL